MRLLDCRPLTETVLSVTKSASVANRFGELRESDGRDLIDAKIPNSVRIPVRLKFPHNGEAMEGIVFKSQVMEEKWDIYIYDSVMLFARSWTGELRFRAWVNVGSTEFEVVEIESEKSEAELAPSHVFFLIGSHGMNRVLPHRLPAGEPEDPLAMATLSFSLFGKYGCYATFEDITGIEIPRPVGGGG